MYEHWIETLILIDVSLIAFAGKWTIGTFNKHGEKLTKLQVEIAQLRVRLDECNCD